MDKIRLTPEWAQEKLDVLREEAVAGGKMPASLYAHLLPSDTHLPDQPERTLPRLAQAAAHDIDIETKYPIAFRQLLTDRRQQQLFLSFLTQYKKQLQPTKEPKMIKNENYWSVYWHSSIDLLHQIFAITQPQPNYRRSESWLTNQKTILYKGRMQVGDAQIALVLEGMYTADKPNTLQLAIAAAANPPLVNGDILLEAHINWGDYDNYVTISGRNSVNLPPVELDSIFDKNTQQFTAGLHFTLEPQNIIS